MRPHSYSPVLRKSSRKLGKINYADLVNGVVSHQDKWRVLLESHQFLPDNFERIAGKDLTLEWLRSTKFKDPVIIQQSTSDDNSGVELDMKMPLGGLTVDDVRDAVGADTPVEVIDVATQSELTNWDMGAWADYFKTEPKDRVYNVISLEISGTPLADQIRRPRVVRELDWIENFWPESLKETEFPKVQLYCLMSVKDSFTDFHIDFAGSSVFYHILSGAKTFYFVEPTPTHLRKYAKWSSSADQSTTFFADEVGGKCYRVDLKQGDTMLIPAGWIHAVYTPKSSMVIGGNFIHSLHIPMQYRISDIEIETNVSPKFRFPFFEKLNWFVALGSFQGGQAYLSTLSATELRGLLALTVRLANRQKSLKLESPNKPPKDERHMIRASVPTEAAAFTPDGPIGLLRELNALVCSQLESRKEVFDSKLKLLTKAEESENGKKNPALKLRFKLNSTASSTYSEDEEPTSDEEWNLDDEGFDETKDDGDDDGDHIDDDEDGDDDDDIVDDGALDLSSDSEYDEGVPRKKNRSRSKMAQSSRPASTVAVRGSPEAASSPTDVRRKRLSSSLSETVYFDDDGDNAHSDSFKPGMSDDDTEDVGLGLSKKRKIGVAPNPAGYPKIRSLGGLAPSLSLSTSSASAPSRKKPAGKAVAGSTAKDRIKNLLLKRR
ncbi:JmjC domain-containing histone demethylation protein 1 [Lunasporangiospora selenospora]|uniref:[histone H3]-dimethyl-L-lysine(36) demethylase n=1 Tax=Lunasporangiospora selenospora TaxID=979761 RepID=A0A9P6FNM6_9FUNG|nr:JmjC domain-containing histone demethylation protein 1 [Lunasporangiospora selenospora]